MPHRAFIGIGTNLGDKAANYREAIIRIAGLPETRVLRESSVYETDPVGEVEVMQPFFNGAIEIETEVPADLLMRRLLAIERIMGRKRAPGRKSTRRPRHKPRVIDLDLLFFDREIRDTPALTLPHARLHERRFVLAPMAELAPVLIHPKLNVTISHLLATLKSPQRVTLARAEILRPHAPRREAASR